MLSLMQMVVPNCLLMPQGGRNVHAVPQGRVAQPVRRTNIADKDLGAVEPDSYVNSRPSFRLPGIVDALHAAYRPHRRGAGAQNVVRAFNRGIPERHDAIADELVDGAALFRDRRRDFFKIGRDLDQQVVRGERFGVAGKISRSEKNTVRNRGSTPASAECRT